MRFLIYYFVFRKLLRLSEITNHISQVLKLPKWKTPNQQCIQDRDCPPPYACCHDPFFPMDDKYCCLYYKTRKFEPLYALNYIEQ